jgi:hypothetical protein
MPLAFVVSVKIADEDFFGRKEAYPSDFEEGYAS